MEFKRINSGTVRCIVDQEDLLEYDIKVEDFFKNSENLHEFLHTIVEKAIEEVGYEPRDVGSLSMQVMPLPSNRLAITLSENNAASFADLIENIKETLGDIDSNIAGELGRIEKAMEKKDKRLTPKSDDVCTVLFESYKDITKFALSVDDTTGIMSSLYYDEVGKVYFLVIRKGRASKDRFVKLVGQATEYGDVISDRDVTVENIKEHCKLIIKTKAISSLVSLA